MVVTNAVTTHLANPSVISVKKVEQIEQTGEKRIMTTINQNPPNERSSTLNLTMTLDGIESQRECEEIEFDDSCDVDYDLDYTVQY